MAKQTLSIGKRFDELRAQYEEVRESYNCLLIGDAGSGKTYSLRTARLPVLVYQFDPGGAVTNKEQIDNGEIIVVDYSREDSEAPTGWKDWEHEFHGHIREGLFDHLGTVALDSITTWGSSLMAGIISAMGRGTRAGNVNLVHSSGSKLPIPELRDYQTQMMYMEQYLKTLCGLPCDFIAIGHIERDKDEVSGRMVSGPMVTGKLSAKLPILFDEIYVAQADVKSSAVEYSFLTQPSGIHRPRSRMASEGKLNAKEQPNFKHILKACGREYTDLPLNN